jgi:acyl-CoA reductase-like NAD-dependent aldehyde dehydrogenase
MTPYEKLRTAHVDLGVCAGICAWNGSHVLAAWKMAPAMAAGNTFVLKSSEKSPLALAGYGDLIKEVRRRNPYFASICEIHAISRTMSTTLRYSR